jgi:DMSO/TMAO reductase YedYZ heme-binding membrane subunit
MSTSERIVDTRLLKQLTLVSALVPAALLVWDAWHGQLGVNAVNFVIRTTGLVGLVLITLSLLVTPVRELTGWGRAIAMRRGLGIVGFAYLVAHFLVFFLLDRQASVSSTVHEIATRRYLWFGTAALVLMVPLAATSMDAMVARLGAIAWKRLHRLAYPIAIGGVLHYYLLVKSDVRGRSRSLLRSASCCSTAWPRAICGGALRRPPSRPGLSQQPRRGRQRARGRASW